MTSSGPSTRPRTVRKASLTPFRLRLARVNGPQRLQTHVSFRMTPHESTQLTALETRLTTKIDDLDDKFSPALEFYQQIAGLGKFIKWGVGIGAGFTTILGGLHILGIL